MDLISPSVAESSLRAAAAEKQLAVPGRPKRNAGGFQLARIEGEDLVGWRQLVHVAEVLFEKSENLGPREIIKLNA